MTTKDSNRDSRNKHRRELHAKKKVFLLDRASLKDFMKEADFSLIEDFLLSSLVSYLVCWVLCLICCSCAWNWSLQWFVHVVSISRVLKAPCCKIVMFHSVN